MTCSGRIGLVVMAAIAGVGLAIGAALAQPDPGRRPFGGLPSGVKAERDLPYAGTDNPRQKLDLYLPAARDAGKPLPLVVFIHGGGWRAGDRRGMGEAAHPLLEDGRYAVASVGYRLTDEASWPAQIHDCKAAIRWLRANAATYGLDPGRIGVIGPSAGGHLVAMLGTSGGVTELEGDLGDHDGTDSRVTCVVDLFGPTDLLAMGGQHDQPGSPEARLVGGAVQEHKDAARGASPVTYVSRDDPPFLLIHGTEDPVVPFSQSQLLHDALREADVSSTLVPVTGGGHGRFGTPEVAERVRAFFARQLLEREEADVAETPIEAGTGPRSRRGVSP
jgi:acetyl esterase/lipase